MPPITARTTAGLRSISSAACFLASGSIPGAFPPVQIDVEGNGKHFSEMHVDGGVGGQFFVAPPALMAKQ